MYIRKVLGILLKPVSRLGSPRTIVAFLAGMLMLVVPLAGVILFSFTENKMWIFTLATTPIGIALEVILKESR